MFNFRLNKVEFKEKSLGQRRHDGRPFVFHPLEPPSKGIGFQPGGAFGGIERLLSADMGLDLGNNGSSKHSSESEPEAVAGEASCTNPFETYPELRVRIGSCSHFEMNPEMIDGSPSTSSSGPHSAVIDQSSISNHLTLQPDAANEGDHVVFPIRLGSSSSSASSASSEDLFQVETKPSSSPLVPANEPHQGDTPPVLYPLENAASSSSTSKSEDLFQVDAKPSSSPLVPDNETRQGDTPPILNPQENAASSSSSPKSEDLFQVDNKPSYSPLVPDNESRRKDTSPVLNLQENAASSSGTSKSEDIFQVDAKPSSSPLVPDNEPNQKDTPSVLIPQENAAYSSSSSKSEVVFQVDTKPSSSPLMSANEPHQGDTPPVVNLQENAASSSSTSKLEDKEDGFPSSTLLSPVSNVTPEPITSPTRSPPVQVTETIEGYDPFRIPASIFERSSSTTPLEWSVASNDSLFSIHIGNNSFSRDHSFVLGEMYKSGELYRTGEPTKSGELFLFSPTPPLPVAVLGDQSPAPTIDKNTQTFQTEESVGLALGLADDKPEEATGAAVDEEQNEQKKAVAIASRKSSGPSLHSGGSGDSVKSFAFPAKKKKRYRSSCYGSNCRWAFCYTWPRCYFRWPGCYVSNCSWAFCYSWNCSRKRCLTDTARSGSDKTSMDQEQNDDANVEEENLQPSPATPGSPKSGYCSWFCCFPSCCSWNCPQRFRCFC